MKNPIQRLTLIGLLSVFTLALSWGQNAALLEGSGLDTDKASVNIYGHVMTDVGFNFGRTDPKWFDVMRPTKLPANASQFGKDGNVYFSVRQTRVGTKFWLPAGSKDIRGIFEWELFGTGADAGQTTFRLRHAYLQRGAWGAGQYWSVFMDISVFPNSIEYWGPVGMVFFRNIQLRWMPLMTEKHNIAISLEKPGGSNDEGVFSGEIANRNMPSSFPYPDIAARYRIMGDWGHFQIAGIVRNLQWDDVTGDGIDLSGSQMGGGLNLTTNINAGPGTIKAAVVYGAGIQNYMNDGTTDYAIKTDASATKAIPLLSTVLFYDFNLNDKWSSTVGFSTQNSDFSDLSVSADKFKSGQYGLLGFAYSPVSDLMSAIELQYGRRENNSDGWTYDALRIQFAFKYKFSAHIQKK